MLKFEVRLRTITPTFMYGADGKTPEIRPQSIKGLLRFWYRALSGEDDLGKLHKEEGKIFGSTDEKIGSAKVSVRVKNVVEVTNSKEFLVEEGLDLIVNRKGKKILGFKSKHLGIGYLYYNQFDKNYLKVGSEFTVVLSAEEKHNKELEKGICSLWCLVYFGGIGSRSRRTAGSLEVVEVLRDDLMNDDLPFLDCDFQATTALGVKETLLENFVVAKKLLKTEKKSNEFSVLEGAKVKILNKPFENWLSAVNWIGREFQKFRNRRGSNQNPIIGEENDYQNVKNYINNGNFDGKTTERAIFGLPLNFQYRSLNFEGAEINLTDSKKSNRRASPLCLKIIKVNGKFFVLLLKFNGKFLNESDGISIKTLKKNRRNYPAKRLAENPNFKLVNKFLQKMEGVEEIL